MLKEKKIVVNQEESAELNFRAAKNWSIRSNKSPENANAALKACDFLGGARKYKEALGFGWRAYEAAGKLLSDEYLIKIANAAIMSHKFTHAKELLNHVKDKGSPHYFTQMGIFFQIQGDFMKALDYLTLAYKKAPDTKTRHNLSICHLTVGNWKEGWSLMRDSDPPYPDHKRPKIPLWDGKKVKRLLIVRDQGMGDVIQFIRFRKLLPCEEIYWYCEPRMANMLRANFPEIHWIADTKRPFVEADAWCGVINAVAHLDIKMNSWKNKPYFHVEQSVKNKLPVLGFCWQGNLQHGQDHQRSIDLQTFLPYLKMASSKYQIQSLQFGGDIELPLWIFPCGKLKRYEDTAKLVNSCDIVWTVDSSIAHIAGALGKKTHMVNRISTDWRWGMDQSVEPKWYNNFKVWRQIEAGEWDGILAESLQEILNIVDELK